MCFDGFNHAHNFIKALNGSLCFLYLLMAITLYCIIVKRAIFKCVNCTDFFVLCDWYNALTTSMTITVTTSGIFQK